MTSRFSSRPICLAIALASGIGAAPVVLAAERGAAETAAAKSYRIPVGALGETLARFAAETGISLSYEPTLTQGKRSAGLQGSYGVAGGLAQLLAGTGLEAVDRNDGGYTLRVAQDVGEATLKPVQVTGEKIVRSQERTLSSVAVATSDDIREHGDTNLQQILDRTPGVYTQSGNENWGIRGVPVSGFDDQGPAAVNGAVSMLVDDALQANRMLTFNPLQLWDVEQVEVYRGAQSTTQGRNSLAGAVVMRTKSPTFEPEFAAQVNAGKYGERGASALASGALGEVVAGRVAIDYQSSDGYIDNETLNKDANITRASDVRGKLLVKPSDKADLLLTVARTEHRAGNNGVAAQDGKPFYYTLFENTDAHDRITQNTATAKFTYQLDSAWSFTSVTSGTWAKIDTVLDFDQEADTSQAALRAHKQDLLSQELRLGYGSDQLSGFFGVYYGKVKGDTDEQLVDDGAVVLADTSAVRVTNAALFGEVNWEFVERWQLIAGLRFDHEKNSTDVRTPIDEYELASDLDANEDKNFNVWLPKIGISHDLTENQLLGLVWQRGYRSGGVNVGATTNHAPYDPEYTKTIELSWRGNWLDNALRTSANIYHTDWDDQQVTFLNANDTRQVTNAADSRLQGIEFSAEYRVTRQLGLTVGAAYNDTKYLTFVTSGSDYSGQDFLFAPKKMGSIGANYLFTSGLMIAGDVVYQSASTSGYVTGNNGEVTDQRRSDSATLVNLNAEYTISENILVNGYVKNVFDKRYVTNNQGDTGVDVGAPLTFGVAIRYDLK